MSSSQLDQIEKKRVELKNELQAIEQGERTLEESIRMLEEKLAIRELEDRVEVKRQAMKRLESRKRDLERRLSEPQRTPQPSPMPQKPPQTRTPQDAHKRAEPQEKEAREVTRSTRSGNQQPIRIAAPTIQHPRKQQEKKKRKWF